MWTGPQRYGRRMQIVSVQTGRVRDIASGARVRRTGIDKQPVDQVEVDAEGVVHGGRRDPIVNTADHGGPGQAVYVYARSDYEVFEADLGLALPPGSFGENVTVDRWPHDVIRIGDRFRAGQVELEVSGPRVPCATFAARMAEIVGPDAARGWVKRFQAAGLPGWYTRVLAPGALQAGMVVQAAPASEDNLTGMEMWSLWYAADGADADLLARALRSPVADRARPWLAQMARAAGGDG